MRLVLCLLGLLGRAGGFIAPAARSAASRLLAADPSACLDELRGALCQIADARLVQLGTELRLCIAAHRRQSDLLGLGARVLDLGARGRA